MKTPETMAIRSFESRERAICHGLRAATVASDPSSIQAVALNAPQQRGSWQLWRASWQKLR